MVKVTNLDQCKSIARFLLEQEPQRDNKFGFILIHPILKDIWYPFINGEIYDGSEGKTEYIDILEDKEAFKKIIQKYIDIIDNSKTFYELLDLVNQPYRMLYMKMSRDFLSDEEYGVGLIYAWTETEMPALDINVSNQEYVNLFKNVNKAYLMEKDDLDKYNSFGNTITIYRGVNNKYNNVKALSWSLSIETAKMFATRFAEEGTVYEAKINKEYILAYNNDRNEQEIIVDYTKLYDIKPLICNVTKQTA